MPVHHVTVQDVAGRLSVSLDLEVDRRMTLGAAHSRASKLEAAIRDEFGPDVEVDTHIEPLRVDALRGTDEAAPVTESLAQALRDHAAAIPHVCDVHSVRVRRTGDGLVVNYHCRFDPALAVQTVHACVDELEHRFRADHPEVLRVIGHAEPLRREEARA